jgi:hypothetical protein
MTEINQQQELDCLGRPVGTFEAYQAPKERDRPVAYRKIRLLSYVTFIGLYLGAYAIFLGGWAMTTGTSIGHLGSFAYSISAIFAFVATRPLRPRANDR